MSPRALAHIAQPWTVINNYNASVCNQLCGWGQQGSSSFATKPCHDLLDLLVCGQTATICGSESGGCAGCCIDLSPPSPPPPSPPPPMAPPPPPPPPFGCTESVALNYRSFAIVDDGSCILGGCTDGLASNFDPRATYNGARTPNPASRALADAWHAWGTSATTTSHTHAPSRTICCRSQLPSHAHI